ncbi:uncharacterized protein LY89DRAFT_681731 [Mollisia scopiformis]|uniref:Rdx family-domain-containing protein n=1 Tax=Mollisia scopiformis TaxID=149040 RepID=A0A194XM14_MOLSC|nr:uncharacterized protein LY89DRAFT_681731 [Mollisia scopiformis]KUJ21124.1 hypothetical protein LY89DRAFT_681731 [Mollisia scopiformis]
MPQAVNEKPQSLELRNPSTITNTSAEMEQGPFPRVTIQFCTQCKWMLRAAYFAQELLSTFSTSLGEVALQPSTGGTFVVHLYNAVPDGSGVEGKVTIQQHLLWDRKAEGGFPETKELKRRVRDIIDPSRDLGHVDGKKSTPKPPPTTTQPTALPRAINRLQSSDSATGERKFTPMDVDVNSRPGSSGAEKVVVEEQEGTGVCRPSEDCEDCG